MVGNGEKERETIRPEFDRSIMIAFQGVKITSDTGFLLPRATKGSTKNKGVKTKGSMNKVTKTKGSTKGSSLVLNHEEIRVIVLGGGVKCLVRYE